MKGNPVVFVPPNRKETLSKYENPPAMKGNTVVFVLPNRKETLSKYESPPAMKGNPVVQYLYPPIERRPCLNMRIPPAMKGNPICICTPQ